LKAIAEECCFPKGTELRLRAGDPAEQLVAIAEKEDAELLVVASQGEGRIRAALLGSVSSALMHTCPCPVVVVPPNAIPPLDSEGMRGVVCGVGGNERDVRVLRLAAGLAARLGGDLYAVHAYDPRALHAAAATAPGPPLDPELRASAERRLARILEESGGASGSSTMSASERVPSGAPDQESGGERSSASQLCRRGIGPACSKALL
jgi:nucleotide-binding universal stress UspA family protein